MACKKGCGCVSDKKIVMPKYNIFQEIGHRSMDLSRPLEFHVAGPSRIIVDFHWYRMTKFTIFSWTLEILNNYSKYVI